MSKRARRGHGDGSLYQRGDGLWVGSVDLPLGDDGRRRRKTVSSTSYATAAKRLRDLRREIDEHGDAPGSVPTVGVWLEHWLTTIAVDRARPRTLAGYRTYLDNYLIPGVGRCRLDKLRAEHVRTMLRGMEQRGLSDATRRQAFAILRRALLVAQREQLVRTNVCTLMDPPRVPTTHREPFTLAEARQILAHLDVSRDPSEAARWLLALLLGLRQGEALGLDWGDVDEDRGRIHVRQALQRQTGRGLVLVAPKSASSLRSLPLLPQVSLALSLIPGDHDGLVFRSPTGGPRDPRADWGAWRGMLKSAGVAPRPLHAARNTAGSLLNAAGVPDKTVSEILGHAQVQITQSAYIRGDEARHEAALLALDGLIHPDMRPS